MSIVETNKGKRRIRLIVWPLVIFVALIGIWSGIWTAIRSEVDRQVDLWIEQEKSVGRAHQCSDRSYSGFPFRIDLFCRTPSLQMHSPTGMVDARFGGVIVTALIYRPEHIIIDFKAPFVVSRRDVLLASVDFQGAQASISMRGKGFERFSLAVERPTLTRIENGRPELAGQILEVHARPTQTVGNTAQDFDLAVAARGIGPAGVKPELGADLMIAAVARGLPNGASEDAAGLIAAWARAGGLFELGQLRLTRGTGILGANGKLGFNPSGRAQGGFEAVIADSAALLGGLSFPGFGDLSLVFGPALTFVGRSGEIEGKRGTKVDLRLENGHFSVGSVHIIEFAPAF